ncbi:hypothetical protein GOB94_15705 [Granulicella sp. 5B5]|uniref:GtrA family protein n=1 Tax=Granulicella sp. 5B5 TaxID=1617967 RepID=UPI0015F5336B|nr:GtrA family protein [Granulicella sp. 5B5]QMV19966.1 hypothetical protein GOB94_15705 [Granulicella sp. 5B5]
MSEMTTPVSVSPQRPSLRERVLALFPPGQFLRYLCVGCFNTAFSYVSYATALTLLTDVVPTKYLYLTVVMASAIVTPINITVSFTGYKYLVFRSKGHYLHEWMKAFAVYGVGWIPSVFTLSALTGVLQAVLHHFHAPLHAASLVVEAHLSGAPLHWVQHAAHGKAAAGYISGIFLIFFAMIYSFLGHKHVTFRQKPSTDTDAEDTVDRTVA